MSKMVIELNLDFDTGHFEYNQGPEEQGLLPANVLKEWMKTAKPSDFGIAVSVLDPAEGWCTWGINFLSKGLKRGGKFEYVIDEDTCTAKVSINGTFTSVALRRGMDTRIAALGKDFDLRFSGLIFKSGRYDGFESFPSDCDKENPRTWKKIEKWSLI